MTEKRFTVNLTHYSTSRNYVEGITDNQSNTELKSIIEIIDLLNEQHETIQHLTDVIRRMEYSLDLKEKSANNFYLDKLKLEKENEKLKEELKNLRRLANELYMEGSE